MAFPVIFLLIAAGAALAGGGLVLADQLKSKGVNLALVGRPSSGKSTLLHYLKEGEIPSSPLGATTQQEREWVEFGESVVEVIDSGGDETRVRDWQRAVQESDPVLYLFDASLVAGANRPALAAIEADLGHFTRWRLDSASTARFLLVATHADQCTEEEIRAIDRHQLITRLKNATDTREQDVVLGSLATNEGAKELTGRITKWMEEC